LLLASRVDDTGSAYNGLNSLNVLNRPRAVK
jgi:hypothetical protein